jgi:hypothetical protein
MLAGCDGDVLVPAPAGDSTPVNSADVAIDLATTCPSPDPVLTALVARDPCFSGAFTFNGNQPVIAPPDAQWSQFCGAAPAIVNTYDQAASHVVATVDAASSAQGICLAGTTNVDDGVNAQAAQIQTAIAGCTDANPSFLQVVLDATGTVTDVLSPRLAATDASTDFPLTVSCIKAAFAGLSFSCLQSVAVCGAVPVHEPFVFD